MLNIATFINHDWMIHNNSKIVNCLEHLNNNSFARSIQTHDFNTFYTKLNHGDIKKALALVINLAFNMNKSKPFINVYSKSSKFVKKPHSSTISFNIKSLILQ